MVISSESVNLLFKSLCMTESEVQLQSDECRGLSSIPMYSIAELKQEQEIRLSQLLMVIPPGTF